MVATNARTLAMGEPFRAVPSTVTANAIILGGGTLQFQPQWPSMRTAHVTADPTVVNHCVFCGSGAIVGRSDGGIECTLCNRSFTVMEQPLYSNMPSTDPGAAVEATPFDPLMQEDPFDPGQQPLVPPTPPVDAGQGQPPAVPAQPAPPAALPPGGQPTLIPSGVAPFVLGSGKVGYATRSGILVEEDDFILHHAIRLARGE